MTEIRIKWWSPKYWRAVRLEGRRLSRDQRDGHGWIWIRSESVAECYRCGDRITAMPADSHLALNRPEFELIKGHYLNEEGLL